MKTRLTQLPFAANAFLIAALLWMHVQHRNERWDLYANAARVDEITIRLLATSLETLETAEGPEVESVRALFRPTVENGLRNIELRDELGLPR